MGNSARNVAEATANKTKSQAKDAVAAGKKMIESRFIEFQQSFNLGIGDLQKIKGKYIISFSKEIFFQTNTVNEGVNDAINGIVGMFSGGNIAKTIGNLMKTAFKGLQAQFYSGYNQKSSYFTCIGDMGDMFRVDYLYVSNRFSGQGITSVVKCIQGTYVIVSSINKAEIAHDLNVFQIIVNKQFPQLDLPTKFMLLKLAKAEKIEDVNQQEIGILDQKFKDIRQIIIQATTPQSSFQNNIDLDISNTSPFLTGRIHQIAVQYLMKQPQTDIILVNSENNWAHYLIKNKEKPQEKNLMLKFPRIQLVSVQYAFDQANTTLKKFKRKKDDFLIDFELKLLKMVHDILQKATIIQQGLKITESPTKDLQLKKWDIIRSNIFNDHFVNELLLEVQMFSNAQTYYPLFRIEGQFQIVSNTMPDINKTASGEIVNQIKSIIREKKNNIEPQYKGTQPNRIKYEVTDQDGFITIMTYDIADILASKVLSQQEKKQIIQSKQQFIPFNIKNEIIFKDSWALQWHLNMQNPNKKSKIETTYCLKKINNANKQAQFTVFQIYLKTDKQQSKIIIKGTILEVDNSRE